LTKRNSTTAQMTFTRANERLDNSGQEKKRIYQSVYVKSPWIWRRQTMVDSHTAHGRKVAHSNY